MNEFGVTIPRIAVLAVYKRYTHLVDPNLWLQDKLVFVTAIVFFFLREQSFYEWATRYDRESSL
jgi:hypothetical protein